MLTGDNVSTAKAIAKQAGIDDARGNLLPEDKLTAIEEMQKRYGYRGNDGRRHQRRACTGALQYWFRHGRRRHRYCDGGGGRGDHERRPAPNPRGHPGCRASTHAILWQNIAMALGIKAVFLVLAVFGSATMWMAVFADMGASLLVVFNGLRLLKTQK
jgi:Cd2+/Zn2+-exporting ATPase